MVLYCPCYIQMCGPVHANTDLIQGGGSYMMMQYIFARLNYETKNK